MEKKRIAYIDIIKFIACIGVFLTHFYGAFNNLMLSSVISSLNTKYIKFLLDGDFQIGIFACISGYLVSRSKIDDIPSLLKKIFSRYLRFVIPIFVCVCFVYVLRLCGIMRNTEFFYTNPWFGGFYTEEMKVYNVLSYPLYRVLFLPNDMIDGPLWMIGYMLYGSCLIYLASLIKNKAGKYFRLLMDFAVVIASYFIHYVCFACSLGMLIYELSCFIKINEKQRWISYPSAVFSLFLLYLINGGYDRFGLSSKLPLDGYIKAIIAFIILTLIFICYKPKSEKDSPFIKLLGTLSFGIYLFHWPVFCSVGAILRIVLYRKVSYTVLYFIVLAVCFSVSLLLAYLYAKYIEPSLNRLTKILNIK